MFLWKYNIAAQERLKKTEYKQWNIEILFYTKAQGTYIFQQKEILKVANRKFQHRNEKDMQHI